MKLLVASHTSIARGGSEVYLEGVLPALEERGWQVGVMVEGGPRDNEPPGELQSRLIATCPPGADRSAAVAAVRRWKPEVLLQNGLLSPALEADLLRVAPGVLFAHGYYGTCVSGYKRFAAPALQRCHRTFGPACLALYYPRRCGGLNPVTALRSYLLQGARAALLAKYVRICVASEAMRGEYLKHGIGEDVVAVVPLFPGRTHPDPLPPTPGSTEGPILMVGRLTHLKGGTLLLEALAAIHGATGRSLQVQFAGEGPERPSLERLAKQIGVKATFLGWCDTTTRQSLMRSASLLAVPSIWPEPFGLVGLEAACVGLPAVGFAGGGVPDWLIDGYSGMSADGEHPRAETLAAAITRALENPRRYQELRDGAWHVSQRFTLGAHLDQLDPILRAAASRRLSPTRWDG